ncbi:response regulator [Paenibacillus hamazuiensis]|uniref:response regulator n=1 Tax=Paenibacillus hamazuiensis TaxID=2936508 RepID=UPI00200D32E8|nr:response regulator [Paenibacillus hamazuiensis]
MIRVLLIDDEESALDILEILLREIGGVTVAGRFTNPLQALDSLEELQVDAVFLDIQMPGILGVEAARRIKANKPQTQIVFTTAYSEYAVEAFEIRSEDYLLKPFTKERLRNTVSRLVKVAPGDVSEKNGTYVRFLGGFEIQTANGLLPWKTNKEKELCAFLLHHGGSRIDAATIIESIWPESELSKARTYLYTCISYLRKTFQMSGVQAVVDKIGRGYVIEMNAIESDVTEFSAIMEKAAAGGNPDERLYEKLNALHRGEYLEGCDFGWALWKREELKAKYIETLRTMHKHFMRNGNVPQATDSLQRILALSPDSEKDGRELIRLYASTDQRNEALKVFRQLDHAVRVNLGVELEEETVRLYKDISLTG